MSSFGAKRSLSPLSARKEEPKTEGWASSGPVQPTPPQIPQRMAQQSNTQSDGFRPPGRPPPQRSAPPLNMGVRGAPTRGMPSSMGPPVNRSPDRPPNGAGMAPQRMPPNVGRPFLPPPQRATIGGAPTAPSHLHPTFPQPNFHQAQGNFHAAPAMQHQMVSPPPKPQPGAPMDPSRIPITGRPEAVTEGVARTFPSAPPAVGYPSRGSPPPATLPGSSLSPPRGQPPSGNFRQPQQQAPQWPTPSQGATHQPLEAAHSPTKEEVRPNAPPSPHTPPAAVTPPSQPVAIQVSPPRTVRDEMVLENPTPEPSQLQSQALQPPPSQPQTPQSPSGQPLPSANVADAVSPSPQTPVPAVPTTAQVSSPFHYNAPAIGNQDAPQEEQNKIPSPTPAAPEEIAPNNWPVSHLSEEALAELSLAQAALEQAGLDAPQNQAVGPETSPPPLPLTVATEQSQQQASPEGQGTPVPPLPLSGKLAISGGTSFPPPFKGVIKVPEHSPLKNSAQAAGLVKKKTEEEIIKTLEKQEKEIESLRGLLTGEKSQVENLRKKCFEAEKSRQDMKAQVERLSTQMKFKENEVQELINEQRKKPDGPPVQTKWEKEAEMCAIDSPHSEDPPDAMNTANASGATTFRSLQAGAKPKVSFSAGTKGGAGGPGKRGRTASGKNPGEDGNAAPTKKAKRDRGKEHHRSSDSTDDTEKLRFELAHLKNRLRGIKRAANGESEKEDSQSICSTLTRETKRLKLDMTDIIHSQLESFGTLLLEQQRTILDDKMKGILLQKEPSQAIAAGPLKSKATGGGDSEGDEHQSRSSQTSDGSTKRKLKLVYNKCLGYKKQLAELKEKDLEREKRIAELQATKQHLEEQIASLQKANESFAATAQRVPELESKVRELDALKGRAQELEKEKKTLSLMRDKAREKRKRIKEQCKAQEKKVKELEAKAAQALKDRDLLAEWARGKEKENEDWKREKVVISQRLNELTAITERQESLLQQKEEKISVLLREKDEAIFKLETIEATLRHLQQQQKQREAQNESSVAPQAGGDRSRGQRADEAEEEMKLTGLTMATAEMANSMTAFLTPNTGNLRTDLGLSQLGSQEGQGGVEDEGSQEILAEQPRQATRRNESDNEQSQSVSQLCAPPPDQIGENRDANSESDGDNEL